MLTINKKKLNFNNNVFTCNKNILTKYSFSFKCKINTELY